MSAGRRVGNVSNRFGDSSRTSVCVRTKFAIGPNLDRMWKTVSRIWLCSGVLEAAVQEKKWSP
jgi:hypothetical protein